MNYSHLKLEKSMRTFLLTMMLMLSNIAFAQTPDKSELYGGLQYRVSQLGGFHSTAGWQGSGTYFVTPKLGATADFGGTSTGNKRVKTFMFGPTLKTGEYNFFKTNVFTEAHVLIGAERASRIENSGTGFAMAVGGSVDIPIKGNFSVRPINLDYIYSNHNGGGLSSVRYSGGVVFKFKRAF